MVLIIHLILNNKQKMTRTDKKSARGEKMTRGTVPEPATKAAPAPEPAPTPAPTPIPTPTPPTPEPDNDSSKYRKSYAYLGSEYNIFRLMLKESNIKQRRAKESK